MSADGILLSLVVLIMTGGIFYITLAFKKDYEASREHVRMAEERVQKAREKLLELGMSEDELDAFERGMK